MSLASQSQLVSDAELEKLASQPPKQDSKYSTRSPLELKTSSWVDGGTQPKMFPGIVHERTRRSSIKQGSDTTRDVDPVSPLIKASSRRVRAAAADDDDIDE